MNTNNSPAGFAGLSVAPRLVARLAELSIVEPTPVQTAAIPILNDGADLIAVAQTGTGKTLAFALPIAQRPGESALILAPTRELAQQIEDTFRKLGIESVLVVGGLPMNRQIQQLRGRYQAIIATPGRLIDHLDRRTVRLNRISVLVLDEADRMLDMGFAPAIQRIIEQAPTMRQTALLSATMPDKVVELASNYLRSPERVDITPKQTTPDLIDQELRFVEHEDKRDALRDLLYDNDGRVLVFARTRHGARKLAKAVREDGHTAAELHADRTLAQRRDALAGFKLGAYRVLVATDIAARGIDVKDISLVINFDVPENPEDYVHRIGRTGRAGSTGRAITLALPNQARDIRDIERLLGIEIPIGAGSAATPRSFRQAQPAVRPQRNRPQHRSARGNAPQPAPTVKAVAPKAAAPKAPFASGAKPPTHGRPRFEPQAPTRKHRGWSGRPKRAKR